MPTIAKTNRYRELDYRLRKLLQLYSVFSEVRLHLNVQITRETAEYYRDKLYTWGNYGAFMTATYESMMQVFFIELDGYIGAYKDKSGVVKLRKNESGSLGAYLYDGTRVNRKRTAKTEFEQLLNNHEADLALLHKVRPKLAHFAKLEDRNLAYIPADKETRDMLNSLVKVVFLLGFQKLNEPHFIEINNSATASTTEVIDKLIDGDERAVDMRNLYSKERTRWYGK